MSIFHLPDLGEGLPEAEIVRWHIKVGDHIKADQTMVSVETAKAVVDVPAPQTGIVSKLFAKEGDMVKTGAPLIEFNAEGLEKSAPSSKPNPFNKPTEAEDNEDAAITVAPSGAPSSSRKPLQIKATESHPSSDTDAGTVVGSMQSLNQVVTENAIIRKKSFDLERSKLKVTPAVRALARRLNVELSGIKASGKHGQITASDVRQAADSTKTSKQPVSLVEHRSPKSPAKEFIATSANVEINMAPSEKSQTADRPSISPPRPRDNTGATMVHHAQTMIGGSKTLTSINMGFDISTSDILRGPRRFMEQTMSAARDQVAACSIFDDADINDWTSGQDITARIIRAIVAGIRAEPRLNAWFDGENHALKTLKDIDLAIAVDTSDGLIVPVLRKVQTQSQAELRAALERMKKATHERSMKPQDMQRATFTLSNFGMMAGRYATPVIVPPTVAILASGGVRHDVVAVMGGVEVHRRIPLSLTFDHRCITGGEACRFLAATLADLQKAN